ncbi:TNT domain-containing protein [Actinoallomurus iriomotensis]|uniref:TNT domain-containing protein n=1 Tax=Actinoallomurus iriomotensis TaxID=478107 RepID=A0A9W6SFX8_9ACTN|nr:TNT domain-containing protein [Actinoallomurus iriomotensis]GLY92147.1 hypothetical protein Airi02_100750 [Actinoallomurus iriomotensis]
MNRAELQDALRTAQVPDDLYALPGLRDAHPALESYYRLDGHAGGFVVSIFERGGVRPGPRFATEDEACQWLYGELVFQEPRPRTLADGEEQEARERVQATLANVTALVRHAARAANATTTPYMLDTGLVVDQFGQESGTYLYPDGMPFPQRSLPPSVLATSDPRFPNNYHRYQVAQPFRVRAGIVAPAFEQPGGGVQFRAEPGLLAETPALLSIKWLLRSGHLQRMTSN